MAVAIPNNAGFSRWVYIVWGILSIIAGFFLVTRPAVTALVLIEIMAIFWIVGGIFDFVRAIAERGDYWGWQIVIAIIGIIAGIYIIANPIIGTTFTIRIAYFLLAIYSIIAGIMNIFWGFKNPEGTTWSAIIIGAIQIVVGGWLLFNWQAGLGVLVFVPVVGIFMLIGGIFAIIASFFANQAGTPEAGAPA
jgi:uncharacterized membrane protein HdeD (DUF308 family)